jgi:hypothetical protein
MELQEFEKQLRNLKMSNLKIIEKFIDLESNSNVNSMTDVFPGWHKKINLNQYKIIQRLFHRPKYSSTSNKFIFDIEANKYGEKKIVQFAYYVVDNQNKVIDCDMYYVFNEGVYSDYYNKIRYPTLKEFGVSPYCLFYKLQHVLSQCEILVGHNILTFDCKIIKRYFERFNLHMDLSTKICYDTMKESRYVTNLKNKKGNSKCATLTELSQFFNVGNINDKENFHDALYDVHITYLCYVNLLKIT